MPLGSLTYHFASLEDLRSQAFRRHAEQMSLVYRAHFDGVRDREQLVDAVTELVHGEAGADVGDWAVAYELYLAALRDPALREITDRGCGRAGRCWNASSTPTTARGVDALIEGLVMHKMLSTTPCPARTSGRRPSCGRLS